MTALSPRMCRPRSDQHCRCKFPGDLLCKLRPRVVRLLLTTSVLALIGTANSLTTLAQSQTAGRPAATPTTTPVAKKSPSPSLLPTGTIKGRLVSGDGQPLMNANIMAQALTATPTGRPTRVNSEGRFSFDDLPAASYILIATAPGYIDQSLSLGDVSQWPRHLIGSNVQVTMIRGGVITGVVTNAKGEPTVGVPVHATLQNAQPSIASFFTGGSFSETDDRGIYRIYGLLPGQYNVWAGGNGQFGQFTPNGFDRDVPTYYPSSTRDTAIAVSVRSGDETSGVDIKYQGLAGHVISGVVLGNVAAGTQGGGAITIFLAPAGSTSALALGIAAVTDPRRGFSFSGIADGEYDLLATYIASQSDVAVVAPKRVTIRGGDVTGVELLLAPLASITGTITLDPIKPEDKCDKRRSELIEVIPVVLRDEPKKSGSLALTAMLAGGLGTLDEKGEFALRNLEAASYRLEIKLPTESWYVREIRVPGAAARAQLPPTTSKAQPSANPNPIAWQGVVTIKSGARLNDVSIMVAQDAAGLHGRMGSEGAVTREGTRVHLVPIEREHADNVLRYSETMVKSDGSFALTNIAPGRYFVLTRVELGTELDKLGRPAAWSPAARAKLRSEAQAANTIVELKPCQRIDDFSALPAVTRQTGGTPLATVATIP